MYGEAILWRTSSRWDDHYLKRVAGINSPKWVVAKRELIHAITNLDEDTEFSIVIYSSSTFDGTRNWG